MWLFSGSHKRFSRIAKGCDRHYSSPTCGSKLNGLPKLVNLLIAVASHNHTGVPFKTGRISAEAAFMPQHHHSKSFHNSCPIKIASGNLARLGKFKVVSLGVVASAHFGAVLSMSTRMPVHKAITCMSRHLLRNMEKASILNGRASVQQREIDVASRNQMLIQSRPSRRFRAPWYREEMSEFVVFLQATNLLSTQGAQAMLMPPQKLSDPRIHSKQTQGTISLLVANVTSASDKAILYFSQMTDPIKMMAETHKDRVGSAKLEAVFKFRDYHTSLSPALPNPMGTGNSGDMMTIIKNGYQCQMCLTYPNGFGRDSRLAFSAIVIGCIEVVLVGGYFYHTVVMTRSKTYTFQQYLLTYRRWEKATNMRGRL